MSQTKPIPIVARAAEKAGGISALARSLGVSRQAVFQWNRVPAERVLAVETYTGVPRYELRPDIYPRGAQ
jgi:DNA-binding transcriptional regulator YdaS (Cro superfamily)